MEWYKVSAAANKQQNKKKNQDQEANKRILHIENKSHSGSSVLMHAEHSFRSFRFGCVKRIETYFAYFCWTTTHDYIDIRPSIFMHTNIFVELLCVRKIKCAGFCLLPFCKIECLSGDIQWIERLKIHKYKKKLSRKSFSLPFLNWK